MPRIRQTGMAGVAMLVAIMGSVAITAALVGAIIGFHAGTSFMMDVLGGDADRPSNELPFFGRAVLVSYDGRTSAGIIWDGDVVVTTGHGIGDASALMVEDAAGRTIQAAVLYADPYSDVAVISAHTGAEPAERSPAGPGDDIYAIGHPNGRPYAVTKGVISSTERPPPIMIQHDAAVSTGSSGGPLVDGVGRVAGMTAAMDDLAFAIPYDIIHAVVESVLENGRYEPGCVGVRLDGNGVVESVREEMSGAFSPGDVILSVDGGAPSSVVYERSPGEVVEVELADGRVLVVLGVMEEWFGVHACHNSKIYPR